MVRLLHTSGKLSYSFRNTDNFSFNWTVIIIVTLAIVLMLPFHGWNEGNFTYYAITNVWQFLVQAAIPSITIIFLNVAVYKRLKLLRESEAFKQADEALKKSILRARLSMWIAIIFVTNQCIGWLRLPYDVRYILQVKSWSKLLNSFQIITWTPNFDELRIGNNRKTMLAFGTLMYSINLSSNFFVYKYLLWKERRTLEKSEFYVNMDTTIL